jgi:hypothetical protein
MSNAKKYEGVGPSDQVSSEAPEWLRRMSDRYVATGTVLAEDAARLRGQTGPAPLTQSSSEPPPASKK